MSKTLLFKNAVVLDPRQSLKAKRDILVEGGKIKKLGSHLQDGGYDEVIDLEGRFIVPGFVDMHVHLREPGEENKETIFSGSRAAVAGGITSLCCMPNTQPPIDNPQTVKYVQERADKANMARIYPLGTITLQRGGDELTSYGTLLEEGVKAFSDDGKMVASSSVMYHAMSYIRKFDALIISHCEEETLSRDGEAHEGYWSSILGLQGLPPVAEELAVARDILLARDTGARLHLAHVSLARSVEWIKWAKEQGIKVTAETTPHHLLLDHSWLEGFNPQAKMRPPLRTEADRRALLQGLKSGVIDAVATDHAPHREEDKSGDFTSAAFGITGLETAVPLLLTELVKPGVISLEHLVSCYSCRPAEILGIDGGTIKEGSPADLVVLDLEAPGRVESRNFYSRGKNTPFEGWKTAGKPVMTVVEGQIKMKEGDLLEG